MHLASACVVWILLLGLPGSVVAQEPAPALEIRARHIGETDEKTLIVEGIQTEGEELRSVSEEEPTGPEIQTAKPDEKVPKGTSVEGSPASVTSPEPAHPRPATVARSLAETPEAGEEATGAETGVRGSLIVGILLAVLLAGALVTWQRTRSANRRV